MEMNNLEIETALKKAIADFIRERMDRHLKADVVTSTGYKKQMLVLMPDIIGSYKKYLTYIKGRYLDYDKTLGTVRKIGIEDSGTFKGIFNLNVESQKEELGKVIENFDSICLIQPPIELMEALANLDDRLFCIKLILYSLFHYKKVDILMDYDLKNHNRSEISNRMKKMALSLENQGINLLLINDENKSTIGRCAISSSLVVEQTINHLWKKGQMELEIQSGCIITPLARDRARELKFKLIENP